MSSLVYLRGELVDTTTQYAELRDLYENRHRYNRMPLTCTREHRGRMYLRLSRTDKNRVEVAHYPGQGGPGCTRTIHHEAERIPHRTFKGYSARACESAGYTVTPEFKTTPPTGHRSTRLDLAVQAPTPFGIEAQFSTITQRDAKSRTTSSFHGGWPPLWLPGSLKVASQIGHYVPQLRHNDTEIDWHTMPSKGTASATSIKRIRAGHCTVTGPFDHCPNRRGGFCGQWHPWFNEPALGWTLDAGPAGIGAGALVIHQDATRIVRLVAADDLLVYLELTGLTGELIPRKHRRAPAGHGLRVTAMHRAPASRGGRTPRGGARVRRVRLRRPVHPLVRQRIAHATVESAWHLRTLLDRQRTRRKTESKAPTSTPCDETQRSAHQ